MEFLVENILNLVGFLVGLAIGIMSMIGFRNTGSATLFRLSVAFFAISAGFCVMWVGFMAGDLVADGEGIEKWVHALGIGIQTVGYFFIAFSHSIKAFMPKNRYFRTVAPLPLLLASSIHIEHILRSVSFILLVYGAIETMMSYFESRRRGTIAVAAGLAMLALGEFLSWYSFVFPESVLYLASNIIKIGGLIALFVPVSRIPLTRIKIGDGLPDLGPEEPEQSSSSASSHSSPSSTSSSPPSQPRPELDK